MSTESTEDTTVIPSPTLLLDLGKLLTEQQRTHDSVALETQWERIHDLEEVLLDYLRTDATAKKLFDRNEAGYPHVYQMRVLAIVAHRILCSESYRSTLASVAISAVRNDDPSSILQARQAAYRLCKTDVLEYRQHNEPLNGELLVAKVSILNYIVGKLAAPVMFTEQSLALAKEKRSRRGSRAKAGKAEKSEETALSSPKALAQAVSERVIGAEMQPIVRAMSTRVFLHMKRAEMIRAGENPGTPNEVILILGPSGVGKTHLVESIGRVCNLPFGVACAADVTEEGYVGLSVADMFTPLIENAGSSEAARFGMLFIDEIDSKRSANVARDVSGRGVQKAMLKVLEGAEIQLGGRRSPWSAGNMHSTVGTFFALAGAFAGLDRIVGAMSKNQSPIGFHPTIAGSTGSDGLYPALEAYGIVPEVLNRLTGVFVLGTNSVEQLVEIAAQTPHGIISTYNATLGQVGTQIVLSNAAVRVAAEFAADSKTYSRGIKRVLSSLVDEIVYEGTTGTIRIGVADVRAVLERMQGPDSLGGYG